MINVNTILTEKDFFEVCKKNSLEATYNSARKQIKNIDISEISIKKDNRILKSILSEIGVDSI